MSYVKHLSAEDCPAEVTPSLAPRHFYSIPPSFLPSPQIFITLFCVALQELEFHFKSTMNIQSQFSFTSNCKADIPNFSLMTSEGALTKV